MYEGLNITTSVPPTQTGKTVSNDRYRAFGFSMQGKAHVNRNIPCQDNNDIRYIADLGVFIAGISDGVGSCPLSHWGSYMAIHTAMDEIEKRLLASKRTDFSTDDTAIYTDLVETFRIACSEVQNFAKAQNQPESAFHATLTIAIYDGKNLWCCHAGDDGLIGQFEDGFVKLITHRQKGEEASSVYPLQSGESHWQVCKVSSVEHGKLVGFIMATDGVLDAIAFEDPAYSETPECCNGIYYPFIASAIYNRDQTGPCDPALSLDEYQSMMSSENYRKRVTDDLTFVSVVSVDALKQAKTPVFSVSAWNATSASIANKRKQNLYPGKNVSQSETENKKKNQADIQSQMKQEGTTIKAPIQQKIQPDKPKEEQSLKENLDSKKVQTESSSHASAEKQPVKKAAVQPPKEKSSAENSTRKETVQSSETIFKQDTPGKKINLSAASLKLPNFSDPSKTIPILLAVIALLLCLVIGLLINILFTTSNGNKPEKITETPAPTPTVEMSPIYAASTDNIISFNQEATPDEAQNTGSGKTF